MMEKERTRALRRARSRNKWYSRIKELYPNDFFLQPDCSLDGIHFTSWKELLDVKRYKFYKSTPRICSCWMCKGDKYRRIQFSRETKRMIEEQLFD